MVSKNIMNLISLGIHIFPILIKFLLCIGRALRVGKVEAARAVGLSPAGCSISINVFQTLSSSVWSMWSGRFPTQ